MQQPILIVLHQEHSTPGRVGNALRQLGYPLDVRRPRFDDPLPETMAEHAAAIIFGGPMSANDDDDFIRREIDWIAVPLKENKPFLGICLGAQMFAHHLGGQVFRASRRPRRDRLLPDPARPRPASPSSSNGRNASINGTARASTCRPAPSCLAEGDTFEVQAIRYGRGYALQFHPDVTHAMMHRWTTRGHDRMQLPGAQAARRRILPTAPCTTTPRAPGSACFLNAGSVRAELLLVQTLSSAIPAEAEPGC